MTAPAFRPHTLDELLHHAPGLMLDGRLSARSREFVADMIRRGRWKAWTPTEAQLRELRRLIEVKFYARAMTGAAAADDPVLIDDDDAAHAGADAA